MPEKAAKNWVVYDTAVRKARNISLAILEKSCQKMTYFVFLKKLSMQQLEQL
jgi:hypothetical protein